VTDEERPAPADPVLARRRRLARLAEVGQRAGYGLFGLAMAVFVVGFVTGFTDGLVTIVIVALGLGSAMLAPAIVVGYAVKAADREDRERGLRT
jgi:TRAP-type mannitol/chloroaromatic compound transport system permease large subunit